MLHKKGINKKKSVLFHGIVIDSWLEFFRKIILSILANKLAEVVKKRLDLCVYFEVVLA